MARSAALPAPPLPDAKAALAAELIQDLDGTALNWLSGYMAGAAAHASGTPALSAVPQQAIDALRVTVLYGSQTGNAKGAAEQLAERAAAAGLDVRLMRADAYPLRELKKERLLYVVISTHSVGDTVEPPDDSRALLEHLASGRAPQLPHLQYAVLALGDTSYPDFCGIGRYVDERLTELGATRLLERSDADVDFEAVSTPWTETALKQAQALQEQATPDRSATGGVVTPLRSDKSPWARKHPFAARVLANQRIVANDSGKDVHHLELSLEGSGIHYHPGDALGVWATHDPVVVERVLAATGLVGAQEVTHNGETLALSRWLGERRELTCLTRPFVAAHAERGNHAPLKKLLDPDRTAELAALLDRTQLVDLLQRFPTPWDAPALIAALRPLAPRMYSIASSQAAVDEEVHLTVDRIHYERDGETRWGVASQLLCDLAEGATVPVFVDANERFRLPADPACDLIMIGPGTGVAPFRAFVQERHESGASGRQWLFFGNPHRRTDFLYQLEWQQALRDGALTRLSVAFSRDQAHKLYVQDRLREHGRELWSWLDGGAHLYVCGDADHMAPDVHAALIDVISEHGGKTRDAADAWLKSLLTEGRYARDVY